MPTVYSTKARGLRSWKHHSWMEGARTSEQGNQKRQMKLFLPELPPSPTPYNLLPYLTYLFKYKVPR